MKRSLLLLLVCAIGISTSFAQSKHSSRKISGSKLETTNRSQLDKSSLLKLEMSTTSQEAVKVLKSYVKDGKGIEFVQLSDGSVKKRIVNNDISFLGFPVPPKSPVQTQNTDDYLLFESFEENEYDDDPYWVPEGWSEVGYEGRTPFDNFFGIGDETWYPYDYVEFSWGHASYPTDGDVLMLITEAFQFDFETFIAGYMPQDEWLITKEITPEQSSKLCFDFADSYFMNYCIDPSVSGLGEWSYDFDNPKAKTEVYISIDGGETWPDKVWTSVPEDVSFLNDNNIWDYLLPTWRFIHIDLTKYVGKPIKIAFRYVGTNGGGAAIDNVIVGEKAPIAKYEKPQGAFFASFGNDNDLSYYSGIMFGPAYTDITWKNTSLYADTYEWSMDEEDAYVVTDEGKDLSCFYPWSITGTPSLEVHSATKSAEYHWGSNFINPQDGSPQPKDNTILLSGGSIYDELEEGFYSSNVLPNADLYAYIGQGIPLYGPREGVQSIGSYFEKPLSKYMIEGVRIPVVGLDVPADTELKLNIYKMNERGVAGDLIAASSVYYPNAFSSSEITNISFDEFTILDPETELDVTVYLIEIEDAILVELTGFEGEIVDDVYQNTMNFAALFEIDGEDSFGYFKEKNSSGYGWNNSRYSVAVNSSVTFLMDVTYSFLYTEDNRFEAPAEGANHTFEISDFYWRPENTTGEAQWWFENELPEWITVGALSYTGDENPVLLPITVAPLPSGEEGRTADLILRSYGCDLKLQVKQGEAYYVGIPETTASNVKAYVNNNNIHISYPEGTTAVSIYNTVGQNVGNYNLNANGTAILSGANLSKGIYFLKFSGKTNETIKIIK